MTAAGHDPRGDAVAADIRPRVAGKPGNIGVWAFAAAAATLALLLFSTLDTRRRALTAPTVRPRAGERAAAPASPPPLYVPPAPVIAAPPGPPQPAPILTPTSTPQVAPSPIPAPRQASPPMPRFPSYPPEPAPRPERPPSASPGPVLVYDASGNGAAAGDGGRASGAVTSGAARIRAGSLAGRRTTIAQGTLIPAVLETALDTDRPGQARAIVSRDVRGFDGTQVLIPRGSRLYGEYQADLAPGQNRVLVQWLRLIRPDGVTMAINSPSADALGRAGIGGKVDSHFFARFGAALLQSALDVGVRLATQSATRDGVIVAVPGGGGLGQAIAPAQQVRPTLRVAQGTRVAVFVARDLDFGAIGAR